MVRLGSACTPVWLLPLACLVQTQLGARPAPRPARQPCLASPCGAGPGGRAPGGLPAVQAGAGPGRGRGGAGGQPSGERFCCAVSGGRLAGLTVAAALAFGSVKPSAATAVVFLSCMLTLPRGTNQLGPSAGSCQLLCPQADASPAAAGGGARATAAVGFVRLLSALLQRLPLAPFFPRTAAASWADEDDEEGGGRAGYEGLPTPAGGRLGWDAEQLPPAGLVAQMQVSGHYCARSMGACSWGAAPLWRGSCGVPLTPAAALAALLSARLRLGVKPGRRRVHH